MALLFIFRRLFRFMIGTSSRRNIVIRLFGLLAIASLFTSYLMFVKVNADDDQRLRVSWESSRSDGLAVSTPEKSSDWKFRRRETTLEPTKLKPSVSTPLHDNFYRRERRRKRLSFGENSKVKDDVRLKHAKKLKFSVLKDVFRDKRSRRTDDSYSGTQTDGEKYRDEFRDNTGMRETFIKTTTLRPDLNAKSSVFVDTLRGNSQSYRNVNRPVESRNIAALDGTKKPGISNSFDNLSRNTNTHGIADAEKMADKTRSAVEHENKASPTLGGWVTGKSIRNTDSPPRTTNKKLLVRSTVANVKKPEPTRRAINLQGVSDAYRQRIINAPTAFRKHLEPTSLKALEDAKKLRPTPRYNPLVYGHALNGANANIARVFQYVRDIATPGVTSPRRNLIIVAQPRTGSSFFGDAFNQHPDVFYLFEPLRGIVTSRLQHLTDKKPMQFLAGMLHCKFTSLTYVREIEKFRRFSSNALSSPPMCAKKTFLETSPKRCNPLNTKNMETVCNTNYNVTVMKVLSSRIPNGKIDSLFPLCNSSNCSIIYLVRDPRAVVFSHLKVGIQSWQSLNIRAKDNAPRPSIRLYSAQVCRQIETNVRIFQNITGSMKNRYYMVRYEDLARNPNETLQRVYKTTGLTMVNSTIQWIKLHTGEDKSDVKSMKDYNFSTKRNSKAALDKWRLETDPCVVDIIEEECRSVLKLLGYRPLYGSEQLQYDLNVSLSDG